MPSRLLHRSRRDEVRTSPSGIRSRVTASWISTLRARFLEGAGDLLWDGDWQTVWAGSATARHEPPWTCSAAA